MWLVGGLGNEVADRLAGSLRNVLALFFTAWNNRLRTGADKGNPTV
jgi:hypothetical protein